MNITLTGATGFIGKQLVPELQNRGHVLRVLGRREWDSSSTTPPPPDSLASADAIIHLAGAPVAQRWNAEVKKQIRDSRVNGTRALVHGLSMQSKRPEVLISGSAIGFYGDRGDEILTETSPRGNGFLADVTEEWEQAADLASNLGIRVVKLRTGIVLGKGGGALEQMLTPFKMGAGGRLSSGRQWMSWIHIRDLMGLILFALADSKVSGPMNGTAPHPVRNIDFTEELGKALHRPAVIPVPEFGLKLLFGEMAGVLLASQRVLPQAAQAAGYRFQFPDLSAALRDVV
jgi:hypothetical protein